MSIKSEYGLSSRNDQMFTALALLVGLITGIIVRQLTEESLLVILYVTILVFGAYFLASMPFVSNEDDYLPSKRSFRLVWGALLTTVSLLLLVGVYSSVDLWISIVILLAVAAALVLYFYIGSSKGKE
jgi:hypothetical protein